MMVGDYDYQQGIQNVFPFLGTEVCGGAGTTIDGVTVMEVQLY